MDILWIAVWAVVYAAVVASILTFNHAAVKGEVRGLPPQPEPDVEEPRLVPVDQS